MRQIRNPYSDDGRKHENIRAGDDTGTISLLNVFDVLEHHPPRWVKQTRWCITWLGSTQKERSVIKLNLYAIEIEYRVEDLESCLICEYLDKAIIEEPRESSAFVAIAEKLDLLFDHVFSLRRAKVFVHLHEKTFIFCESRDWGEVEQWEDEESSANGTRHYYCDLWGWRKP